MTKREYIESNRKGRCGLQDENKKTFRNSLDIISKEIYLKKTHFIFELIQNAEDNDYRRDIDFRPKLRFDVRQVEIEGELSFALIVHNNEIGFMEEHVSAICDVGESKKIKSQGYIGEKGIGFKSVFNITTCPYVFSNGFQFCLPEYDEETGLGYIVPRWVSALPDGFATDETTIVLPLKDQKCIQAVVNDLRDFAPETILFLQKLSLIEISVQTPGDTIGYDVVIEKQVVIDAGESKLVELTYKRREEGIGSKTLEKYIYWLTEIPFDKPAHVQHEKRLDIESRAVSVAIPLGEKPHKGKLFAYLPVREDTGIPFLINADFILGAPREGLKENEWNDWLRNCIAESYTKSLLALLEAPEISFETKIFAYASIPHSLESHEPFLTPIIKPIQERLASLNCVMVLPERTFVKPEKARLCNKNFRTLLSSEYPLPPLLQTEMSLVCPEIEKYSEQLKSIGVKHLTPREELASLGDAAWLEIHDLQWFADLFRHLAAPKFKAENFQGLAIIPVEGVGKSFRLTCDNEQPIYFSLDESEREIHELAPVWLSKLVPIATLSPNFLHILEQQKDWEALNGWMTETLAIYPFSTPNYCEDILSRLSESYEQIEEDQIIQASKWLAQYADSDLNWENLPIILSDGRKNLLREFRKLAIQDIVVPENFNPESGWQHIWQAPHERKHFVILSGVYDKGILERLIAAKAITKFPMPELTRTRHTPQSVTRVEEDYFPPQSQPAKGEALVAWLFEKSDEKTKWPTDKYDFTGYKPEFEWACKKTYYEQDGFAYKVRSGNYRFMCNASSFLVWLRKQSWLPTTKKGYVQPAKAFIPNPWAEDVLGDFVPYFDGELPESIIRLLEIRTNVTVNELIELLKSYSGDPSCDPNMAERVYIELNARTRNDTQKLQSAFSDHALILTKDNQNCIKWYTSAECVWEDALDILGGDFAYLQGQYPNLKDFFVERIEIKESVDTECFAQRWLKLQEAPIENRDDQRLLVARLYKGLKPVVLSPESERPVWWEEFSENVKLYTQADTFVEPESVVLSDDGELRRIFQDSNNVDFVWLPVKGGNIEWQPFYKAFNVPLLSESVTESLEEEIQSDLLERNRYVTESAVKMISSWIRERKHDYERLFSEGYFKKLLLIRETTTPCDINIEFQLDTDAIYEYRTGTYPVFWDHDKNTLIYQKEPQKSALAKVLAKGSKLKEYKDLADWIELVLESSDTERLRGKDWSVPQEMLDLCRAVTDTSTFDVMTALDQTEAAKKLTLETAPPITEHLHSAPVSTPQSKTSLQQISIGTSLAENKSVTETVTRSASKHENINEVHGSEDAPITPVTTQEEDSLVKHAVIDYGNLLNTEAFYRSGVSSFSHDYEMENYYAGDGEVKNPDHRGSKQARDYLKNINNEPSSEERRRDVLRSMLEAPNELVRSSLYQWYHGKCQICGHHWPEHNGYPFFVAAYLIPRNYARHLDVPANAICLCAEHFVQWRLAAKEPLDVREQIRCLRLKAEGGDGYLSLRFKMVGQDLEISYDERHFLALRKLVEVTDSIRSAQIAQHALGNEQISEEVHEEASHSNPPAIPPVMPLVQQMNTQVEKAIAPEISIEQVLEKKIINSKHEPVIIRRAPQLHSPGSITDPKVSNVVSTMNRLDSHDFQKVEAKTKELILRFISHEEYKKTLKEEGIHITSIKMALDYLVPQFDHKKLGYPKFTDFLKKVCASTNAEIYFKPPTELRLGLRNQKPKGMYPV